MQAPCRGSPTATHAHATWGAWGKDGFLLFNIYPVGEGEPTRSRIGLVVEDLDAIHARLVHEGVAVVDAPEQLQTLADVSVGLMFGALRPLGNRLTQLPFGPTHPGMTAGPTFELFYQSGYLLPHREAAWALMAERLRDAAEFARRIERAATVGIAPVATALDRYAATLAPAA